MVGDRASAGGAEGGARRVRLMDDEAEGSAPAYSYSQFHLVFACACMYIAM
jgi:hypothetical protein